MENKRTNEVTTTAPAGSVGGPLSLDYQVSYESTAAERAALEAKALLEINVDVPQAVTIATSALSRIEELRPLMASLPINHSEIAKVGVFAGALAFIHAKFAVEVKPPEGMQELYEHLLNTRTLLRLDANNLAARGFINAASLEALSGETGFQNVAYDVLGLATLHAAASPNSGGRTAVTAEDLRKARTDASRFLNLLGQREQQLKVRSELNEERRRAFTLLFNAYEEARRAASFLQWREPDKHLPSLFMGRGRRAQPPTSAELPPPNGLVSTPDQPSQPGAEAGKVPANGGVPSGTAAPNALNGARGGNPFAG